MTTPVREVEHIAGVGLFAAGRAMLDGGPMPWGQLGLAALTTAIAALAAMAFVTRMLKLFRRRGYISRHT